MYLIKRHPDLKSLSSLLRYYSSRPKSHYEVLNLSRNCTDKEIKEAFIHMSKEYHPDKNKDVKAQENFVRIVEAYNVLSKPGTRAQYDSIIEVQSQSGNASYVYRTHVPYNLRKNPQYSFYEAYQAQNSQAKSESYYGVKGVKKLPNYVIIMMCFGVAVVGIILQVLVIRKSYIVHRKQTEEKSAKIAEDYLKIRAEAEGRTSEMQTRMLLDRIVAAANPTVATASLGQSLANEKKENETPITELDKSEVAEDYRDSNIVSDKKTVYELIKTLIFYVC